MDKPIVAGDDSFIKRLRLIELRLYRVISNFIERRRSSYWNNDKYHLGTARFPETLNSRNFKEK